MLSLSFKILGNPFHVSEENIVSLFQECLLYKHSWKDRLKQKCVLGHAKIWWSNEEFSPNTYILYFDINIHGLDSTFTNILYVFDSTPLISFPDQHTESGGLEKLFQFP